MTSFIFRSVPRSNILRHPTLNKIQNRKSSTTGESLREVPPSRGGSALPLAIGSLSLGIGVTLLAQNSILKKFFPDEPPPPEKAVPFTDPKLIEEIISLNRKMNQLETQLERHKEDSREKELKFSQSEQIAPTIHNGASVFELSQVIEANNIASESRYEKELEEQRKLLIREHMLKVEGEVLKVENKYRPTINKIRELEVHLDRQTQVQLREAPARLFWISCQSLLGRMRNEFQKPLESDPAYEVLREFAKNNNPLAINVLDSIPAKALKEGVQSEGALIDRFSKIEKVCKRVAMVGENGGGVAKYLVSYLQSLFIINNIAISEDEVMGRELVDPTSWHTFDILARVSYCLAKHNLEQAVRYANQLKGQARVVARDWIRDARVHLETVQALDLLSTYAEATAVDAARQTFFE